MDVRIDDAVRAALRALPPVNELLASGPVAGAAAEAGEAAALAAVRAELDAERSRIRAGEPARGRAELARAAAGRAHRDALPSLRAAVNATGVVLHTNLGRAPLSRAAVERVAEVARGYSTLEYAVEGCCRGSRREHAAGALRRLTGAEDALVVNNNAAAVLLVLAAHAAGREVIVSRGELVEIGGSFRIPDVMAVSGARLVEVGATNRTHLADYERAIGPDTAMILKVHPSNYRIEGFHEEVPAADLARLAHEHGLVFYEDQGSGALAESELLRRGGEHTSAASLAAGADIVSCSGDKLLGAGQAGIVLGRADLLAACGSHPLMRAVRPDKLCLAALEATLASYEAGPEAARAEVPVLAMLGADPAGLRERAAALAERIRAELAAAGLAAAARVDVEEAASTPGGGSLPTMELPGWVVAVEPAACSEERLHRDLVQVPDTPVVTRVERGRVLADVRTLVGARDEDRLVEALVLCLGRCA